MRKAMLVTAIAALLAASSGAAFAQHVYSRGSNIGTAPPAMRGGYNGAGLHGGYRGGYGGGLHANVPGFTLIVPGQPHYIDDGGPDSPPPPTARGTTSPRRTASRTPPANEVPDEVLVEVDTSVSPQAVDALQRRHRLATLEQQTFQLAGTTLYRWRIPDRRSVTTVVRELQRDRVVAAAQPNYRFTLQQTESKPEGDPAQYELGKLNLPRAHTIAKGDNVPVAIIDSAVDLKNPELAHAVALSFDAIGGAMVPHPHGTAIAGLIAAHGKLMGAAPDARILAVRAFDGKGESAAGTTFAILKGLDWAAANGARVINMSFAGPDDKALRRSLAGAHKDGIVLVAAAGNAGPKSPPLYPAADANVIAVSATDAEDRLLAQSNRGSYVAIAAPGAQILVASPGGSYDVSSGTSYSAAEVSGIVALMLQHGPDLKPDQVRNILIASAKDIGPKGRDPLFGAGLADAYGALVGEDGAMAAAPATSPAR